MPWRLLLVGLYKQYLLQHYCWRIDALASRLREHMKALTVTSLGAKFQPRPEMGSRDGFYACSCSHHTTHQLTDIER